MKLFNFSITPIERDGRETPLFKRFLEDLADQGKPMAGVQYRGGGNAAVIINGKDVATLLHAGEALVFKLEEAT